MPAHLSGLERQRRRVVHLSRLRSTPSSPFRESQRCAKRLRDFPSPTSDRTTSFSSAPRPLAPSLASSSLVKPLVNHRGPNFALCLLLFPPPLPAPCFSRGGAHPLLPCPQQQRGSSSSSSSPCSQLSQRRVGATAAAAAATGQVAARLVCAYPS